jgi:hypothetical protein
MRWSVNSPSMMVKIEQVSILTSVSSWKRQTLPDPPHLCTLATR